MANNFDLSALALQMACPGNVQILDDKGLPGAYVPRQAMQLNALLTNGDSSVHPAFLYNGVQKDTLYIGKYAASVNLNAKIQAGETTFVTSLMMTNDEPQMMVAAMMSRR